MRHFRTVLVLPSRRSNGADGTRGSSACSSEPTTAADSSSPACHTRGDTRSGEGTCTPDRDRRRPLADARLGEPERYSQFNDIEEEVVVRTTPRPNDAKRALGQAFRDATAGDGGRAPGAIDELCGPRTQERPVRRSARLAAGAPLTARFALRHLSRRSCRVFEQIQNPLVDGWLERHRVLLRLPRRRTSVAHGGTVAVVTSEVEARHRSGPLVEIEDATSRRHGSRRPRAPCARLHGRARCHGPSATGTTAPSTPRCHSSLRTPPVRPSRSGASTTASTR